MHYRRTSVFLLFLFSSSLLADGHNTSVAPSRAEQLDASLRNAHTDALGPTGGPPGQNGGPPRSGYLDTETRGPIWGVDGIDPAYNSAYGTTLFLISVALLSLGLYLGTHGGLLQDRAQWHSRLTIGWSWVTTAVVIILGFLLRAPVLLTPLVDFAPVLLVASVTPAAIGFVTFAQIAALSTDDKTAAVRATVSQAVAFINIVASVATLLSFFKIAP